MWYQIFAYFKFLVKSTNQHGVHSPFVYDLVTKCFYDKKSKEMYQTISTYRNDLLNDQTIVEVKDFGAGSRVFSSNKRKVSAIAKNAGITLKRAKLLARLVSYFNVENSLELGTSLGMATIAMKEATEIFTLEGCPKTAAIAQKQFKKYNFINVNLYVDEFSTSLSQLTNTSYDLIYIDGNHQKEATVLYFEQLLTTAHNNSMFIFDDIHWSNEMLEAWEIIKNRPEVTVTIDTFFWGFVFIRQEQVKEHFVIRV
jgi:predicted O-methyltransferase YrrM